MIHITRSIALADDEIEESFVRASGPGGQHVNTTSTAVQLRFDVRHSPSLPQDVRARLEQLAGSRLTNDGVLVIRIAEADPAVGLPRLVVATVRGVRLGCAGVRFPSKTRVEMENNNAFWSRARAGHA